MIYYYIERVTMKPDQKQISFVVNEADHRIIKIMAATLGKTVKDLIVDLLKEKAIEFSTPKE